MSHQAWQVALRELQELREERRDRLPAENRLRMAERGRGKVAKKLAANKEKLETKQAELAGIDASAAKVKAEIEQLHGFIATQTQSLEEQEGLVTRFGGLLEQEQARATAAEAAKAPAPPQPAGEEGHSETRAVGRQ